MHNFEFYIVLHGLILQVIKSPFLIAFFNTLEANCLKTDDFIDNAKLAKLF
jgi:hypothetical protein|tara:strand:+ start:319 stop:471 length:153 start_codon:yes stop_codon:yes gene_type:complete